jgi:tRNA_anti-like
MTRKGRKFIGLLFLCAAFGVFYAWSEYDRAQPDTATRKADVVVSAADLYTAFATDEGAANTTYLDKVVQVSGTIRSVDTGGGKVNVVLESGDPLAGVVCEFDSVGFPAWGPGLKIQAKGVCAGSLIDVVLQRCAPVE